MAPPAEPPRFITLRFKVQPGQVELPGEADEFSLGDSVPVTARIGQVRERIQAALPLHPSPERQRMLYGGRALIDNEQTLADALNIRRDPTQKEYVVHLVVKSDGLNTAAVSQGRDMNNPMNRASSLPRPIRGSSTSPAPEGARRTANGRTQQSIPPAEPSHAPSDDPNVIEQRRLQAQIMHNQQSQLNNSSMFQPPSAGLPQLIQHRHAQGVLNTINHGNMPAQTTAAPSEDTSRRTQPPAIPAGANPAVQNINAAQVGPYPTLHQPLANQGLHFETVGPNGERITVQRQTFNFRHTAVVGQQMPPWAMPPTQNAHMQHLQPPQMPPSLDRMRENIRRMQARMNELNSMPLLSDAERSMVRTLQGEVERLGALVPSGQPQFQDSTHGAQQAVPPVSAPGGLGLIHPQFTSSTPNLATPSENAFSPSETTGSIVARPQSAGPFVTNPAALENSNAASPRNGSGPPVSQSTGQIPSVPATRASSHFPSTPMDYHSAYGEMIRRAQMQQRQSLAHLPPGLSQVPTQPQTNSNLSRTQSSHVSCWLLSSPQQVPTAVIYVPQHGIYRGASPYTVRPFPTSTVPGADLDSRATNVPNLVNPQAIQAQEVAVEQIPQRAPPQGQQAQQQVPAQQEPLGLFAPVLGHAWLLLRILIFSYFLLGANLGWRRPLALVAIGVGFWMIRVGLLGDGGLIRRWWDGIMNDARPAQQQDQNQAQQQVGTPLAGNARPGQMPTPEQVAQRILNDDARARNQGNNERSHWIRERIRPVERAVALLFASLWPGVGEAYVRAREQEERRRAEEEVAARRREEEERQRRVDEEKKQVEESGESQARIQDTEEAVSTAPSGEKPTSAMPAQVGESSSG